jgi:UDP-N-acetylmuramate dehydrogenase
MTSPSPTQSLAARTTLRIGGFADRLVIAHNEEDVRQACLSSPVTVLGGGSNVLIADGGIRGVVLAPALRGLTLESRGALVALTAGAGEVWDEVVAFAVARGLAGIECLSGIPGWVGAVPIQNVGAYGQEVADTIHSVRVLDRATGVVRDLSRADCRFGYRDSVFKHARKDLDVVLAVTFHLRPGMAAAPRYGELSKALAGDEGATGDEHDLARVRETVLALRGAKGMVLSSSDPDSVSAGSFFTNPIVPVAELPAIVARAAAVAPGATLPTFVIEGDPGHVKLAAGWLIERAGFRKGEHRGRVGLSSKHALALINRGHATAQEVLDFSGEIQQKVRAVFGVSLEREPVLLGF